MPHGVQRGTSIDLKNVVLFLKTKELGSGAWAWMALKFGDGNLTHAINKSYDYKMNRGKLDDVRRGDDQVLDVSFEGKFTNLLSNFADAGSGEVETYSLHEILEGVEYGVGQSVGHGYPKFAGTRESWLAAYGCPPYCCDIEIHNNPALECTHTEAIGEAQLIRYFRPTSISGDFSSGMVNVSGEAHVLRPMVARVAGPAGTPPSNGTTFGYNKEINAIPFDDLGGPGGVGAAYWPLDPRDPLSTEND